MKKLFCFLLLFCFFQKCFSQTADSSLTFNKTYNIKTTNFSADQMGNLYITTPLMQLVKINANGDSIASLNLAKRLGNVTNIDASNPLKTLLFYKDYATLITVDRQLNITNTIDLKKQNIFQVKAATTSFEGFFWIYDEQEAKLKKINNKGNIILQSNDLRTEQRTVPMPQKIIENNNTIYLYDSLTGIFIYDNYGAFNKYIPFKSLSNFYVNNKIVYGFKKNKIIKYNISTQQTINYSFPNNELPTKIHIVGNKIYFLYKDKIKLYNN